MARENLCLVDKGAGRNCWIRYPRLRSLAPTLRGWTFGHGSVAQRRGGVGTRPVMS